MAAETEAIDAAMVPCIQPPPCGQVVPYGKVLLRDMAPNDSAVVPHRMRAQRSAMRSRNVPSARLEESEFMAGCEAVLLATPTQPLQDGTYALCPPVSGIHFCVNCF